MALKFGLVGGGHGGFIGGVHRRAATFDGLAQLVAGAFSRNPEASAQTAKEWGVSPERTYRDYREMAEQESQREDGIDFVSIATPNFTHYEMCKTFLQHGIHVVCDKPMTLTVEEAEDLERIARENGMLLGVSYTYSGYPIVEQARQMIQNGEIGKILTANAHYAEDYLIDWEIPIADGRNAWLIDPEKNGKTGCVCQIATHAEYLLHYVTGLKLEKVLANFQYTVPNVPLETDAHILMAFEGGVHGMMWSSCAAIGHHNDIGFEILGDKGTISWKQYDATRLTVDHLGGCQEIYDASRPYLASSCRSLSRLPGGHPEGYYEAFANVYKRFCTDLLAIKEGKQLTEYHFPSATDGLNGVRFTEACYQSNRKGNVWVDV